VQAADNEFALGITISKKVGKAHLRNLLKRRIKAWVRLADSTLPKRFRLNLIARPGAGELSWPQLCDQLRELTQKLQDH